MKILLVEDNVSLCRNIASVLQNEGYTVVTCSNGNEAEFQMLNNSSDLILLDRMLPGKDGITLTREARAAGITVPILLLTALDTLGDKVTGLDAGADDYIVKPFSNMELLMRVKAILRRSARGTAPAQEEKKSHIPFGDLILDLECQSVLRQGEVIVLTYTEFKILELLVTHKKKIYSLENIYQSIWEEDAVGDSAIMVHIKNIRKKLEDDSRNPRYIKTAWGRGYYVDQ